MSATERLQPVGFDLLRRFWAVVLSMISILFLVISVLLLYACYDSFAKDRQMTALGSLFLAIMVECFGIPIGFSLGLVASIFERWALYLVFLELCAICFFWFLNPPLVFLYLGFR